MVQLMLLVVQRTRLPLAITVGAWCLLTVAGSCQITTGAQTQASLILDKSQAKPGEVVWAGVRMESPQGWHTYWQNAGESGAPTEVRWELPSGISAGPLQWPVPKKHSQAGLVTYVYYGDTVLLTPLMIAADHGLGPLEIKASVSWLECETLCVPGETSLRASLLITNSSTPSTLAPLIETRKLRLPRTATNLAVQTAWGSELATNIRQLAITWETTAPLTNADFFPLAGDGYEVGAATDISLLSPGRIRLQKTIKKTGPQWPMAIPGLLAGNPDDSTATIGYQVNLAPAPMQAMQAAHSVWLMLLYAFLGGLILNVMPCVLPVIALKILGFVSQSRESPGHVRVLGCLYVLGVLASFMVLALVVVSVQQAGQRASWGMQFGNPIFLVVLCVLVTLVALNLFGIFEVTLSGKVMNAAGGLAAQEGKTGAFFNGVLATALATPCTAPFLGVALGFAFVQPPHIILLFFVMVGIGLALPYFILSWHPAWLQFLPKPGAWMVKFKVAMGFPMLATAIWLYSLSSIHYGRGTLWLGLFLVMLAFSAWIFGEWGQRGRKRQGLARVVAAVLIISSYFYAMEAQLRWRERNIIEDSTANLQQSREGIPWRKWTPEAVDQALQENHIVLVDFTADWCLTCNANKKFSLEIEAVRQKIRDLGVIAFLADYTRPAAAPEITAELQKFGRAGVPLVLVYSKNRQKPPIVLPELLTPKIVIGALETAAQP